MNLTSAGSSAHAWYLLACCGPATSCLHRLPQPIFSGCVSAVQQECLPTLACAHPLCACACKCGCACLPACLPACMHTCNSLAEATKKWDKSFSILQIPGHVCHAGWDINPGLLISSGGVQIHDLSSEKHVGYRGIQRTKTHHSKAQIIFTIKPRKSCTCILIHGASLHSNPAICSPILSSHDVCHC